MMNQYNVLCLILILAFSPESSSICKSVNLPTTSAKRHLPKNSIKMCIGLDSLTLEGEALLKTDSLLAFCSNDDIDPKILQSKLKEYRSGLIKKNNLSLIIDRNIPYCILFALVNSGFAAGYNEVHLASKDREAKHIVSHVIRKRKARKGILGTISGKIKGTNGATFRSRESIAKVVSDSLPNLKLIYDKFLKHEHFEGRLTIKLLIDEYGTVQDAEVIQSTIENHAFASEVILCIKQWDFRMIDNPGDITEVVYPFDFRK